MYLDDRLSPMKTSFSALTGKSWGAETSGPASNEEKTSQRTL